MCFIYSSKYRHTVILTVAYVSSQSIKNVLLDFNYITWNNKAQNNIKNIKFYFLNNNIDFKTLKKHSSNTSVQLLVSLTEG